jgi:3-phenylpropionate/cinnamic acid dioxygenase small subunit
VNAAIDERRELTYACERFLYTEATLLDRRHFRDWLALCAPEIRYEVPLRVVRIGGVGEHVGNGYYLKENYDSLETRIARFESEYAWAEDPPTRARRNVSNVFVEDVTDGEVRVRSNIFVIRYRIHQPNPDIISGERVDRLQRDGENIKLLHRDVYLDCAVLATHNFALIL